MHYLTDYASDGKTNHVVKYIDGPITVVGKAATSIYLVMELVDGSTLFDFINVLSSKKDHDSQEETDLVLDIMLQISHAVYFVRRACIVNNDIKPENIMLGHDGRIVLIDFGLACFNSNSCNFNNRQDLVEKYRLKSEEYECAKQKGGSLNYIAPEIFEQRIGQDYNFADRDAYAVGRTFYELVQGCHLYEKKQLDKAGRVHRIGNIGSNFRELDELIGDLISPELTDRMTVAAAIHFLKRIINSSRQGTFLPITQGMCRVDSTIGFGPFVDVPDRVTALYE